MFTLRVKDVFAAAHRLDSYHGKCEALHGHNFKVEAFFQGERLNSEGMLVDFALLKGRLKEVIAGLDHVYLNEIPFFRERASSSEYLALYIYDALQARVKDDGVEVREVRVWESETACASYTG